MARPSALRSLGCSFSKSLLSSCSVRLREVLGVPRGPGILCPQSSECGVVATSTGPKYTGCGGDGAVVGTARLVLPPCRGPSGPGLCLRRN